MICPRCQGTAFDEGGFEAVEMFHDHPVVLRNVRGQRCQQCGELILGPETLQRISEVLLRGEVTAMIEVTMYDLAAVMAQER